MNGMHMYPIDTVQMGGFLAKHMLATNVLEAIPIIGSDTIISALRRLIIITIHTMLPGGGVSGTWKILELEPVVYEPDDYSWETFAYSNQQATEQQLPELALECVESFDFNSFDNIAAPDITIYTASAITAEILPANDPTTKSAAADTATTSPKNVTSPPIIDADEVDFAHLTLEHFNDRTLVDKLKELRILKVQLLEHMMSLSDAEQRAVVNKQLVATNAQIERCCDANMMFQQKAINTKYIEVKEVITYYTKRKRDPPKRLEYNFQTISSLVQLVNRCVAKSVYTTIGNGPNADVNTSSILSSVVNDSGSNVVSDKPAEETVYVPTMVKQQTNKRLVKRKTSNGFKSREFVDCENGSSDEDDQTTAAAALKKTIKLKNYSTPMTTTLQPSPTKQAQAVGGKNLSILREMADQRQTSSSDSEDTCSDNEEGPPTSSSSSSASSGSTSESEYEEQARKEEPVRRPVLARPAKDVSTKPELSIKRQCT